MEYWKFVRNFQALVDDKIDDSSAKLSYLLQHCQSKARRLIYGRPHMIAHACVKKATEGSQVHHNHFEKHK